MMTTEIALQTCQSLNEGFMSMSQDFCVNSKPMDQQFNKQIRTIAILCHTPDIYVDLSDQEDSDFSPATKTLQEVYLALKI